MESKIINLPSFNSYGDYTSNNYGVNCLVFTDERGIEYYFSYKTLIAIRTIRHGLVIIQNYWNNTTGKHLNWINRDKSIRLNREDFDNKIKEILDNYN